MTAKTFTQGLFDSASTLCVVAGGAIALWLKLVTPAEVLDIVVVLLCFEIAAALLLAILLKFVIALAASGEEALFLVSCPLCSASTRMCRCC